VSTGHPGIPPSGTATPTATGGSPSTSPLRCHPYGQRPLRQIRKAERPVMPHISINSDEPGIRGLFQFRPETAHPLNELVEILLRGPSTLTRGERELIAAYVSSLNGC